jgi:hypothetical protein
MNDLPTRVERQDPIGAAVEEQQPRVVLDRKAARIGDASVIAERAFRPAAAIEGEQRAVALAVGAGGACDKKPHRNYLSMIFSTVIGRSRIRLPVA